MRIITLVLAMISLFALNIEAQTWQWGRGNEGSSVDAWAVATDPSGNVFAAGINFGYYAVTFGSQTVPGTGAAGHQCIMAKYNTAGTVLWTVSTQLAETNLIGIAADAFGNSYMLGTFTTSTMTIGTKTVTNPVAPSPQYFLARFDPYGNVQWVINDGSAQPGHIPAVGNIAEVLGPGGIGVDAAGYVYITVNFQSASLSIGGHTIINADPTGATNDILLAKYDPSGGLVWVKSFGGAGHDEAYGLTLTPAGDIYIAGVFGSPVLSFGGTTITNSAANPVAFIARFDGNGNPTWACGSGGAGNEYALGLAADLSNNVYLTGGLKDPFISFSGATILNPDTIPVLYLVKFAPDNTVKWSKTIGSAKDSGLGAYGYAVCATQCGDVWVSGRMWDAVSVDGHVLPVPPASEDPIFMAGFSSSGAYIDCSALQSGGDDQNGIAADPVGNIYMCSDYKTSSFRIGSDEFPAPTTATGELLFLAKYVPAAVAARKVTCTSSDICLSNFVTVHGPTGYSNYTWNDGKKTASRTISDTGIFWVLGFDSCTNSAADTFKVTAKCDCHKSLFVPNAFTPNGDGENDVFYPRCGPNIKKIKTFRIYNRWGELLFERENLDPNDAVNAWDGTYKNSLPLPDVYVWIVEATCENGTELSRKGSVTVIR